MFKWNYPVIQNLKLLLAVDPTSRDLNNIAVAVEEVGF